MIKQIFIEEKEKRKRVCIVFLTEKTIPTNIHDADTDNTNSFKLSWACGDAKQASSAELSRQSRQRNCHDGPVSGTATTVPSAELPRQSR